jgi:hypothetical protein
MKSTNGAMDSSWNSDPNPESCRNSSPRSPVNRDQIPLFVHLNGDGCRVYFYIEHLAGFLESRFDGF